jgi:hypothetical protein
MPALISFLFDHFTFIIKKIINLHNCLLRILGNQVITTIYTYCSLNLVVGRKILLDIMSD